MKKYYLDKADSYLPEIKKRAVKLNTPAQYLTDGDSFVIDMGNYYTGYFSFEMKGVELYPDAPVKLCVKFCETAVELDYDFSSYNGDLCASWLQEEIITVDYPGRYEMMRRYAARYIKITVLYTPVRISFSGFEFCAVTSADETHLKKAEITDEKLRKIDEISVNTLKNCMQRVFEDGPKRDRRLWIGDLRLEALINYYTFNNFELVKRCLYLFASQEPNESGFIPGFVYDYPEFVQGDWYLMDYSLLFVVSLCDYYKHSKDSETFFDLYDVAESLILSAKASLDGNGIITVPDGCDVFIDWCEGLEKITSLHGVYLYALDNFIDVLEELMPDKASQFEKILGDGRKAAVKYLYDEEKKAFVNSADNYQCSIHSAVWMILGGCADGSVLENALKSKDVVKPFTPYMHHYILEAMFKSGMEKQAFEYIKQFWGGMVDLKADTFFEVYVPGNSDFSPYGDKMMNSMCHAWSCTPSYFIRKYLCKG